MRLDRTELARLREKVIDGVMDRKNAGAAFRKGERHFMEHWDWYQGVALFGLYQYARKYKDEEAYAYLRDWYAQRFAEGLPMKNVNSLCPMLTLSFLYEETGNPEYKPLLDEWLRYAMEELPRTVEGGFQHITIDSENHMQLWCDTLYMAVLFVARMGVLTGEDRYVQESARQFIIHLKYLTDTVSGLFYHGWTFDGCHHFADALWGRGNAWYTAGLVDYLELAKIPEGVRATLITALERQAEALARYQDAEGMWHTLIDQPETSYAESSATAGFAYGMLKACRLGYLDQRFSAIALKALDAIAARVEENGALSQVSRGTRLMGSLDDYRRVPLGAEPYGQSLALLLFTEADHWVV